MNSLKRKKMPKIIFIFSLPRSGSTLLQKILASNSRISTASEPWLLLPLLYPLIQNIKSGYVDYDYASYKKAITSFIHQLPNKERDYYREINRYVRSIYEKNCSNYDIYFLDKTPRYYLIIPEIAQSFPESKFIFLFRNPLAVLASICNIWHKGTFYLNYNNKMDLNVGVSKLLNGYELLKDKSISINYENLVKNPEIEIKNICCYLNIDFEKEMVTSFSKVKLEGGLGDTKVKNHSAIHTNSINCWKCFYNSPIRKRAAQKYLSSIPENYFSTIGYDKYVLVKEILSTKIDFWNAICQDFYTISMILWKRILR